MLAVIVVKFILLDEMTRIKPPRIGILASGSGTTAEAYARAVHQGTVNAEIGVVVASNEDAGILDKVQRWNNNYGFDVQTAVINGQTHPKGKSDRGQTDEESHAITELMFDNNVRLVALLGYMTVVRGDLMQQYGYFPEVMKSPYDAYMLNSHPGPLPDTVDTFGQNTARKVLDLGLTESKHTVHMVAPEIDQGPIIAEHPVPVLEGDLSVTLMQRTQMIEKATIAYAIDKFVREQNEYHLHPPFSV